MLKRYYTATLIFTFSAYFALAQLNLGFELNNELPALNGNDTLKFAWAGGLNNPQFSSVDLDSGMFGVADLFIYDRDGATRKGFKFNAVNNNYEWLPNIERHFPKLVDRSFCVLKDYNGDGFSDIFTANSDGDKIRVFKNVSDSVLKWELVVNPLKFKVTGSPLANLIVGYQSVPIFEDFDNDGDLDIMQYMSTLKGTDCGVFVLISNQSVENYGVVDSLEYLVTNKCWGKIGIGGGLPNWRPYSCDTTCSIYDGNKNDIAISQAAHDVNGDGTIDLFLTYTHSDTIYSYINVGGNTNGLIDLDLTDHHFPSYDTSVRLQNMPQPYFIDVDHDGYTDMLVAANQVNTLTSEQDTSQSTNVDHYYRNIGTTTSPNFHLEKVGFLSGEMIDVGIRSFPTITDLNGDGLPDLVIGNIGYNSYGANTTARLTYYRNVGALGHPVYKFMTSDLGELSQYDFKLVHPAFADMDSDGDIDLIVGDETGKLHYFRNTGYPAVYDFHLTEANFQNIDNGEEAHPQLIDLNQDGLPDLVIGDAYGRIYYHENSGTLTQYDFSGTPTISQMGGINLWNPWRGKSTPFFSNKIDSTGERYLFVSSAKGRINVYGPINNLDGNYPLVDSIVVEANETSIFGANLTGDFRHELLIGQRSGGIYFMNRTKDVKIGVQTLNLQDPSLQIYPNPNDGVAVLTMGASDRSNANLVVFDISGHRILEKTMMNRNGYIENINLCSYPAGVYFVSVQVNKSIHWVRLIKE